MFHLYCDKERFTNFKIWKGLRIGRTEMTTNRKFIWSHLLSWWITSLQLFLSSLCQQNHVCQIYLGEMFSLFVNCGLLSHTLKFGHWLVRWVRDWRGTKKKKGKAFNQLKPMCNSLAWNLEAASHDKFPLHNNGLQLLWIKFLSYRSSYR